MLVRRIAWVAVVSAALAAASQAPAASAATHAPTQPAAGDWEGIGPHGLRMSFALTGRGRRARVPDAAVSLPNGCRSAPEGGFSTVNLSRISYYPPTRYAELLPGGAFTIKQPGQFAIVGTDVDVPKYPVVITGSFRSSRAGSSSVPVYSFKCPRGTGWSKQSRFSLRRSKRTVVRDGRYAGTVTGPGSAQISGTVHATVVGGGRVLTDFAVTYRCSSGTGASFELGPSRAVGEFIGPTGLIEEHWTPAGKWSAGFAAGGDLAGTFTDQGTGDCSQGVAVSFSASPVVERVNGRATSLRPGPV